MRLQLLLPKVEPKAITVPSECPYPGCGSQQVHLHQPVKKTLRDTVYEQVEAQRYRCLTCGRTLRVYPIGGGMLLAAATVFIQRTWAVLLSATMGLIMIGWEIVEVAIIGRYEQAVVPSTVVQQILFSVLGLVIFGLAASLWMTEYPRQSLLTRHASHAY